MTTHLFDPTLPSEFGLLRAACGCGSTDTVGLEEFRALKPDERCSDCVKEADALERQYVSCPICPKVFSTPEEASEHAGRAHVLRRVSDRKEAPSFVVDMQSFYDESDSKALCLARAREELQKNFPDVEFDFIPSRMMISRDGDEIHVASYLVVPKFIPD